ncbi:hypothetical protein FRC08_001492 [Ceratobasidium sp. 394]|nr:hypothetical protein FRC08_001492 [Ceratobasidium sp. 394]
MSRSKARVPSSSPAPIRESQPQPNSPTTTARGTQPHQALYDTPPEGTQQTELQRSERSRGLSARGHDAMEYQHRNKPAATKSDPTATQSNAAATQPHATTATQPAGSQRPNKQPKRQARLRFDGERSSDESSNELERPKPRKMRKTGPKADSPPPKPPGRGGAMARGNQASKGRVVLEPAAARALGDLVGIDVSSATPTALKETLRTLSDPNPPQVGSARRYPQVHSQSSAPLPSLKQGTYYRDRLLELAHPRPSESQTRTGFDEAPRSAKHPRDEMPGDSADEEMLDPDADKSDPDPATLPRLPSFLQPSQDPPSMSSTQGAVVNAFASQREPLRPARVLDFRPTPVPQPKDRFARTAPNPRSSSSEPRPPSPAPRPPGPAPRPSSPAPRPQPSSPEPRPSSPEHWPLGPESRSPSLEPLPEPIVSSRSAAPSSSIRKPAPPDPNTATEEETESEPRLKPKPKRRRQRSKKKAPARDEPPESDAEPPEHRPQRPASQRRVRGTSPIERRDMYTVLKRLSAMLDDGADPDNDEIDSLLQWTTKFMQQRRSAHSSSSRTGPGPSSYRVHAGSSSSRAHAGSSSSHARPGPTSDRRDHQRPARNDDPSGHHTEQEGGSGEDDDVDTDADDPVVAEKSGLGRYPGTRGKVASRAIPLLLSTATRKGIYQEHDTNTKWARNAYRRAWKAFCPHIPYRECPLDLLQTIITRISNLRTEIKKRIRQVVRFLFKFALGLSEEALSANRQLVAQLGHNTFHCRRLGIDKDQYEHPVFVQAICEAYFWYPDTFLIRDTEHIDTLEREGLPLPAVAFVLTMMQECIEEWQTGRFRPRDLNVATQRSIFDAHLQGLIVYRRRAKKRLANFQVKWFEAGLEYAGIEIHRQDDEDHFCQSVTRAENVRADTPTDSEPEYDEDGRLTARSKGKHKARG